MQRLAMVAVAAWLASSGLGLAQEAPAKPGAAPVAATSAELAPAEEFVVTGEREGPRVWRVINGENELVIFGELSPLPKGVTWRSQTIETLIADASLVTSDRLSMTFPDVGVFKMVGLAMELRKRSRNDGKAKLKEVLPPDLYARYDALRTKYGKNDQTWEKLRPIAAASQLEAEAYEDSGIRRTSLVEQVQKIAKKEKRPWKETNVEFRGDVKAAIREADENADKVEIACFSEILDSLERDLPLLRQRANAWAIGDLAALRALPLPPPREACSEVLRGSKEFARLIDGGRDQLIAELETSLQQNQTTFLVASVDSLLRGRLLNVFAEKGYRIESP